ncbi:MAG: MOP flippase family protein [bacterium]
MSDLKNAAINGVRYTGLSSAVTSVLQFVRIAVLARLLAPEDFGLMAMVMLVVNFALILGQMGFQDAIIQRKDPLKEELSTLYWFNIAIGAVIFIAVWAMTPLFARIFKAGELNVLIPVASISFLVLPLGSQFRALAQKSLNFRIVAFADISFECVNLLVSLVCAWALKLEVWSLVWGQLAGAATRTTILMAHGFLKGNRPMLHFARADLKGYLGFGLYRVGATSVNYWNTRVDQLIIGILMGPQTLGYYSVAVNIAVRPIRRLNPAIASVAYPVFSVIGDNLPRLKRGFFQMIRSISFVTSPVLIGMAAVAPVAVPLIMGAKWGPSVPLIQVLVFYALVRSISGSGGSLILARGRADWTFYWNVALLIVISTTIYAASLSGELLTMCWALLSMAMVFFFFHYLFFIRRLIGPCLAVYISAAGGPMLMAGIMGLAVVGIASTLPGGAGITLLLTQTAAGALIFSILAWLFSREDLKNIKNLFFARNQP